LWDHKSLNFYQTTRRHIRKYCNFRGDYCENPKYRVLLAFCSSFCLRWYFCSCSGYYMVFHITTLRTCW